MDVISMLMEFLFNLLFTVFCAVVFMVTDLEEFCAV